MTGPVTSPPELDGAPQGAPPPLHRVVSAWAVSSVGGALVAASAATVTWELLPTSARRSLAATAAFWGWAALSGLAGCAPVEAFAALVRRRSWRVAPLLLLVPFAILALVVVGSAWFDAFQPGDLAGSLVRTGTNLERLSWRSMLPVEVLLLGALAGPIACARAAGARARVVLGVSLPGPALALAWAVAVAGHYRGHVNLFPPALAVVLLSFVLGCAAGLCLGDRLEPRLAGWLARRLRGDA